MAHRDHSPLVFLPALGFGAHSFVGVAESMRHPGRRVLVDLPRVDAAESADEIVSAVADELARLHCQAPILVGHSVGGAIAVRLIARRHCRSAALVLVDAAVAPFPMTWWERLASHPQFWIPLLRLFGASRMVRASLPHILREPPISDVRGIEELVEHLDAVDERQMMYAYYRAFLTPGAAYSAALKLDLNGFTVTLQLADGAYASGIAAASPPVGGNIVVSGNPTTPASVAISASSPIAMSAQGVLTVQNMRLNGSFAGITVNHPGALLKFGAGISFGGSPSSAHILVQAGKVAAGGNNFTIASGGLRWLSVSAGNFEAFNSTITFSGTPAWTSEGIFFDVAGVVSLFNVAMSGAATGKRYSGSMNAVLQSFGAGTASTYFPGNANGTVATGAQQG